MQLDTAVRLYIQLCLTPNSLLFTVRSLHKVPTGRLLEIQSLRFLPGFAKYSLGFKPWVTKIHCSIWEALKEDIPSQMVTSHFLRQLTNVWKHKRTAANYQSPDATRMRSLSHHKLTMIHRACCSEPFLDSYPQAAGWIF